MSNHIILPIFIHCLIILYHLKPERIPNQPLQHTTLTKSQLKSNFVKLSKQLNVSVHDLELTYHNHSQPLNQLLQDAKFILTNSQYHQVVKQLIRLKVQLAKTWLKRNQRNHFPVNRTKLLNYLRGLAYSHQQTFKRISQTMDYQPEQLKQTILSEPTPQVINDLRQIPFILSVSLQDLKTIINGQNRPQMKLLHQLNATVHDRLTFKRYLKVIMILNGVSFQLISRAFGNDEHYLENVITNDSGNVLAPLLQKLSMLFGIPNDQLQAALARANVQSANHSYLARMKFWLKYRSSPVGYQESRQNHRFDRKRIAKGFSQIRRIIRSHHPVSNANSKLKNGIWLVISGWSYLFNFNVNSFIKDNLKHFNLKDHQRIQIKQGRHYYTVKNNSDWLTILNKLHVQLKTVKYAFNLTAVQNSPYSPYITINRIGRLNFPKAKNFRSGLARFKPGRYQFTGNFVRTGIKAIQHNNQITNEYYVPTLLLKNVKHHGKLIAKEVWFNYSKSFLKLGQLETGDLISFRARIHQYQTGHISKNSVKVINYELNYPSSIKLARRIHARTMMPMPKERAAVTGYAIEHNHAAAYDFSFRNYRYARHCKNQYLIWQKKLNHQN